MSEPAEIHDRVDSLEDEIARVRYLASHADKDVSDVRAALSGQTGVLNAIGETQREQGGRLAEHSKRLERLERKVDTGFNALKVGQDQITALLNTALKKSDETDTSEDADG